jgi:hypothetical protein
LSSVKKLAFFDEAAYAKDNDNYGYYLFLLIQNDVRYSSDNYIKTQVFETFLSICKHQKSHTLYTIVANPYIPQDDNDEYAKLLKLLSDLDLEKMIGITDIYYQDYKPEITTSKETLADLNNLNN